jgi:hypothetical protein
MTERNRMRTRFAIAALLGALLPAACQNTVEAPAVIIAEDTPQSGSDGQAPAISDDTAVAALPQPGTLPEPPPSAPAPHIYMALQPDGEGKPISAIFAIDAARDNTPSDDPAIRLTPENGLCNPQQMRNYAFPPQFAASPVISEAEQARGLTAANLPEFMAVTVTDRMLATGLATDREQTRALNICTRKLWQELIQPENQTAAPAGQ